MLALSAPPSGRRPARRAAGELRFLIASLAAGALAAAVVWGCADRTAPATGPGDAVRTESSRRPQGAEPATVERELPDSENRAAASANDGPLPPEHSESPPPAAKTAPQPKAQPDTPPKDPPLPKYIRVLERDDPKSAIAISAAADRPDTLELKTTNVQRFRIDRRELAAPSGRSIALRLDDQVIEWTARYSVLEFARDEQGFWQIVDRQPARP